MPKSKHTKKKIEKIEHHVINVESPFIHSKAHESAKQSHKERMRLHIAIWTILLIIFIIFVASAMLRVFSLLK